MKWKVHCVIVKLSVLVIRGGSLNHNMTINIFRPVIVLAMQLWYTIHAYESPFNGCCCGGMTLGVGLNNIHGGTYIEQNTYIFMLC